MLAFAFGGFGGGGGSGGGDVVGLVAAAAAAVVVVVGGTALSASRGVQTKPTVRGFMKNAVQEWVSFWILCGSVEKKTFEIGLQHGSIY